MIYPETIKGVEEELRKYLEEEPRKDAEYRLAIAMAQVGSLASHMTHDPKMNPRARPYKTREGEKADFGHAVLQIMLYGASRNLPLSESLYTALDALRQRDWKMTTLAEYDVIEGQIGYMPGENILPRGIVWVDPHCQHLNEMPMESILVAQSPTCEITQFIDRIHGIVTDHGGSLCHAAIVARECGRPCIVGTGRATLAFKTGDVIEMMQTGAGLDSPRGGRVVKIDGK